MFLKTNVVAQNFYAPYILHSLVFTRMSATGWEANIMRDIFITPFSFHHLHMLFRIISEKLWRFETFWFEYCLFVVFIFIFRAIGVITLSNDLCGLCSVHTCYPTTVVLDKTVMIPMGHPICQCCHWQWAVYATINLWQSWIINDLYYLCW